MRPSRVLPPVEFWRGVRPRKAANSRPLAKALASWIVAMIETAKRLMTIPGVGPVTASAGWSRSGEEVFQVQVLRRAAAVRGGDGGVLLGASLGAGADRTRARGSIAAARACEALCPAQQERRDRYGQDPLTAEITRSTNRTASSAKSGRSIRLHTVFVIITGRLGCAASCPTQALHSSGEPHCVVRRRPSPRMNSA